jgi:arylsulfatase A-like enzyme
MKFKRVIPISFTFVTLLVFVSCNIEHQQQDQSRPNIIFIMSDDHATKAISAYDSTLIQTPNIDRLAEEGLRFTNANVTNSLCAPSRAVMLTGKYSHLNGLRDNRDTFNGDQMSWVKLLREQGYATSMIGKWHLKTAPQGFDYWDILVGQGPYYNPRFIQNGDTTQAEGYTTDLIMDKALHQLKTRDGSEPFAMLIHNKAPHRNWMPDSTHMDMFTGRDIPLPETFFDDYSTRSAAAKEQDLEIRDMFLSYDLKLQPRYFEEETGTGGGPENFDAVPIWEDIYSSLTPHQQKIWDAHYDSVGQSFQERNLDGKELALWKYQRYMKDYLRTIASVDDNVGRLLDYLDEAGLTENTIVVYTSDQGFFLGEHGWYDKRFMYEPSLKTPLIIRYPKEIEAGSTSDDLVMNLDFAPTFVDAAGLSVPDEMQGRSLRPIFNNRAEDWRQSMYYHYYEYPHGWHSVKKHYGIKTDRYKLIHFYDDIDAWELYDLESDPQEVNNLYENPDYKLLADSLKNELKQLQIQYRDTTFEASLVSSK